MERKNEKAPMAHLYTPNAVVSVHPENGTDFQLDELYKLIGCNLIECINLDNDMIMIVDEEGKLKKSCQYNMNATLEAHNKHGIGRTDWIAGNAIVCPTSYLR